MQHWQNQDIYVMISPFVVDRVTMMLQACLENTTAYKYTENFFTDY